MEGKNNEYFCVFPIKIIVYMREMLYICGVFERVDRKDK